MKTVYEAGILRRRKIAQSIQEATGQSEKSENIFCSNKHEHFPPPTPPRKPKKKIPTNRGKIALEI